MSDDQGDAEFEASLANLDDTGQGRAGGDRLEEGTATDVRRLFAGLHEDLLQIRAIAHSIAERDLTEDVRAVRATVDDLAGRDVNAPVREELAQLRELVVGLQEADPAGQVRADLQPLREGLDRIDRRLADDSEHQRVLQRLDELEGRLEALAAADRSDDVLERIDALSTREQVSGLAADLRAHLADALGGLDGDALTTEVHQVRATVHEQAGDVADTLQRLQETLLDLASGEVVGALWDEFRALRDAVDGYARAAEQAGAPATDVDALLARLRGELEELLAPLHPDDTPARDAAEGVSRIGADVRALSADLNGAVTEIRAVAAAVDRLSETLPESVAEHAAPPAAPAEPDPALVSLQEHVRSLTDEVRALLDAAEVEDLGGEADEADEGVRAEDVAATRELLDSVAEGLAGLRSELHEGLVVEPSDDLTGTLEALQAEIDGLQAGLQVLPTMQSSLDALREAIAGLESGLEAAAASGPAEAESGVPGDELRDELQALRAAVEGVQAQLEEGLVLAEDVELPEAAPERPAAGAEVVDQIASLRDHLTTEIDGLRATISQLEVAVPAPEREEGEVYATVDPDTVDLLRQEIRAAGSVSDQVVDALREELKALRRRLAVKAQERVLSDEQLRIIADTVADRLRED